MKYVIYTEIWKDDNTTENWYYALCSTERKANEVALELGNGNGVYHKVCTEKEIHQLNLNIKNLPASLL